MTTPARRLSPGVYRRRRLVVILALVAIAAAVVLLVLQPWRGGAEPVAAPTSSAPPSPASTTSAPPSSAPTGAATGTDPATVPVCAAADLLVESVTDQAEYQPGQNPQLSIRLTNQGATDCTMNVGTTGQTFTVLSGDDVWWRSTDCQTESADQTATLAAGQSVTSSVPVTWDRTRSSADTCAGDRPVAPGGGATYRLAVSIGGVQSAGGASFLLY